MPHPKSSKHREQASSVDRDSPAEPKGRIRQSRGWEDSLRQALRYPEEWEEGQHQWETKDEDED